MKLQEYYHSVIQYASIRSCSDNQLAIHVCVCFTDAMIVPSTDFLEGGEYLPYIVNCSGTEAHLSDCSTEIICIPITVKCQLPGMYLITMMQTY